MSENSETPEQEKKLQRVFEIEIEGEHYDIAANGHAYLISFSEKDAYLNPIPKKVDLQKWIKEGLERKDQGVFSIASRFQVLLNQIVILHRQLQASRDSRLGVGKD